MTQQYGFMPRLNGLTDDLSHAELCSILWPICSLTVPLRSH